MTRWRGLISALCTAIHFPIKRRWRSAICLQAKGCPVFIMALSKVSTAAVTTTAMCANACSAVSGAPSTAREDTSSSRPTRSTKASRRSRRFAAANRRCAMGGNIFGKFPATASDFGYPVDGKCTLAYSRILDDTEIVIALNLDAAARADYITVDAHLNARRRQAQKLTRSAGAVRGRSPRPAQCGESAARRA